MRTRTATASSRGDRIAIANGREDRCAFGSANHKGERRFDKIKPSEFSINQIFRLFDALDRHQCQLVLDTNLSTAQFTDMFGEPIARRVKENCHVKEYGF
jgi:hypothetical protein